MHGWWTKDGQKISKSTGNVIDPLDLVERYGVDATRYFLMSEVTNFRVQVEKESEKASACRGSGRNIQRFSRMVGFAQEGKEGCRGGFLFFASPSFVRLSSENKHLAQCKGGEQCPQV